jgi:hypothetical protein
MSEYYFEAPNNYEISNTYNGMTFDEFKQLDAETIQALQKQTYEEWYSAYAQAEGFDQHWFATLRKTETFYNFYEWRTHGIPDRDITKDEFVARMYHYVDSRRADDPHYGEVGCEDYDHLTTNELHLTYYVLDQIWGDGSQLAGQPTFQPDDHAASVAKDLGITYDDLVAKGILETYDVQPSLSIVDSTAYALTGKLAVHLFSLRYPPRE